MKKKVTNKNYLHKAKKKTSLEIHYTRLIKKISILIRLNIEILY